jgi:hypothetical protein
MVLALMEKAKLPVGLVVVVLFPFLELDKVLVLVVLQSLPQLLASGRLGNKQMLLPQQRLLRFLVSY